MAIDDRNTTPAVRRLACLLLLLPAALGLVACQTARAPAGALQAERPAAEIARYADAHRRSVGLRERLGARAAEVERGLPAGGTIAAETLDRLRQDRQEYFALREALFELAFLHAPAIVQRWDESESRARLARISLSLLAGADLVGNFHEVVRLVEAPALRRVWNEADPAAGIPAGSLEIALGSYRSAHFHDLFAAALERLDARRARLDAYHAAGDADFRALYPEGVEASLEDARRAHRLLRARLGEEDLTADHLALQALVARSKAARTSWAAVAPALATAIARDGGLVRGAVHVRVQAVKAEFLDLREGLYGLAFKHFPKLTRADIPYREEFRLRAIGLSLLAAATLWENASQVETHLLTLPRVRALLNQGDPALGIRPRFWDHVQREFVRPEYRTLLELGIRTMEEAASRRAADDPILGYVSQEIGATTAAAEAGRDRTLRFIGLALRPYLRQLNVIEGGILQEGKTQFSKAFGNLMGAFEFRKGKLHDQPRWAEFVRARLEPGDLLLEKTPFRLTDKFIPGHFGHVALYVGTEQDLRARGLERHRWVAPHLAAVARGRTIVEALRDGTQLNTLEHFLNVDDLAILRPKVDHVPREEVVQAVALAFSHVGKRYDFAFDNNTWDSIVCSELAFQTYVSVRWPFAKVLSAYTIAPDDVAVVAGSDPSQPFELVAFVHDGRVVHDPATGVLGEDRYVQLLRKRDTGAARRTGRP